MKITAGKVPAAADWLIGLFNKILNSETGKVWYNRPYPSSKSTQPPLD